MVLFSGLIKAGDGIAAANPAWMSFMCFRTERGGSADISVDSGQSPGDWRFIREPTWYLTRT